MSTFNSQMVLTFLKKNQNEEFTKQQIANILGISLPSVTGTVNALVKAGYVSERMEEHEVEQLTKPNKTVIVRYEKITEAGLAYNPEM